MLIWIMWGISGAVMLGYGIRFVYLFYTLDITLHQWRILPFSSWGYLPLGVAFVVYTFSWLLLRRREGV